MNENAEFCAVNRKNICFTCLKTKSDLCIMNVKFTEEYKHFIGLEMENAYIFICNICSWTFQKVLRFKQQCMSAHRLLSKSLEQNVSTEELKYYNNLQATKVDILTYPEVDFDIKDEHSQVQSPMDITFDDSYDMKDSVDHNSRLIQSHQEFDIKSNFKEEIDYKDCKMGFCNDDEIPLIMLRTEVNANLKNGRNKGQYCAKKMVTKKRTTINIVNSKPMKECRYGFTSRMVQERDEYVVIKLTREQVLKELEEKVKSDSFQRAPFKCADCAKPFNFPDVLEAHMKKHTEESGSFVCDICTQRCPSLISFRGHIKSHTTRYKCKLCQQIRSSRQHLLDHYSMTHMPHQGGYSCESCRFHTHQRTIMQRHVKTKHTPKAALACEKCGKLCSTMETLRVHKLRHEKASLLKCPQCEKTFVYDCLLRKHVAAVHDSKTYYCVECDVHFKSSESMSLHFKKTKKHRDPSDLKYECKYCDKMFFNSSSLAVHMSAKHKSPKTHACATCRRMYATRDSLRTHMWKTHKQTIKTNQNG